MNLDPTALLLGIGMLLGGGLGWTFYMKAIRKKPETEEWYDSADGWESGVTDRDASLYVVPFGSLFFFLFGFLMLLSCFTIPDSVKPVLFCVYAVAAALPVIGMIGIMGIPLPWPFVPRWVVDIRKKKRARARERRAAKRAAKRAEKNK